MLQDVMKVDLQPTQPAKKRSATSLSRNWRLLIEGGFVLPALLLFTIFVMYPTLSSIYYAATSWNGLDTNISFNGLSNFQQLLHDPEVWATIRNTVIFTVIVMIVQTVLALLLALSFDAFFHFRPIAILRVLFLLPNLLSSLSISYIWNYIYSPLFGGLNTLLGQIGLTHWQQDWLGNPQIALFSVAFTAVWQSVGFNMIIFLAGLQLVPPELYEAADIDGASSWSRFRMITLPLVAPSFTINIVLTLIGSLKVFDIIYVMTSGGPGTATESLLVYVYKQAFTNNNFGYAGAIGLVSTLFILLISVISLNILRKREIEIA